MGVGGKEEGSNRGMLVTVTEMGSLRKDKIFGGKSETYSNHALLEMPMTHPDGDGKQIVGHVRIPGACTHI